ncbi:RNA polymerase sigma factor (sigma-70 family) [Sphingobium olei]
MRRFFTGARPIDDALDIRDDGATPEEALESTRALARINAAVAALPATLKDPLLLCAIEGMSQIEAGEVLGVTPKAVETRLYRARAKLSEMLRD